MIPHVPSAQIQPIPDDAMNVDEIEAEKMDASEDAAADKRGGGRQQRDKRTTNEDDDSADEDDAMNGNTAGGEKRKNNENYKNLIAKKRLNETDSKV